jgi:phage repressor protein C with HTH and peptisase S24 domain
MNEPALKMTESSINRPLVARIKAQMLRKGLNPKTLAERANVGRSFVYDILNGKSTNPTSSKLTAIADQLNVSVQYLLSGVHPVMGTKQKEWGDLVEIPSILVEETAAGGVLITNEAELKPYFFRNDWIKNTLKTRAEDLRSLYIRGDGMSSTLQEGDMVVVNIAQRTPNPPAIFVLFDGMGLMAKRLEMISKEKVRILSDNPRYAPYERDISEINIIGKVVWVARQL